MRRTTKSYHPYWPDKLSIRNALYDRFDNKDPLTIMPYAPYKGKKLIDLPSEYLKDLYQEDFIDRNNDSYSLRHGIYLALLQKNPEERYELVHKGKVLNLIWDDDLRTMIIN